MYIDLVQIQRFSFLKFLEKGIHQIFSNINPIIITNRKYLFYSKFFLIKIPSKNYFVLLNQKRDSNELETSISFRPNQLKKNKQIGALFLKNSNIDSYFKNKEKRIKNKTVKNYSQTETSYFYKHQTSSFKSYLLKSSSRPPLSKLSFFFDLDTRSE
nr:hypothetical protein [Trentepohlia sp. YN1242]